MKRSEIKRFPMSDATLAALEADPGKELRIKNEGNIYFVIAKSGKKRWVLRYKDTETNKWAWAGLGPYPATSWKQAKRKAAELFTDADKNDGRIVTQRQRQAETKVKATETFSHLAHEWFEGARGRWVEGTAIRNWGMLANHVLPTVGTKPYSEIQPLEWLDLFRGIEASGKLESAKRTRRVVREVYDLALITRRIERNPVEGLDRLLTPAQAQNYPHVPLPELPALLQAIKNYPHAADIRLGLFILSRVALRPQSVRFAEWQEIDFNTAMWEVPAEHTKKKRPHLVPLAPQVLEALKELHSINGNQPLLFPGRGDRTKPRSNTVFTMALRRLGYEGRQSPHGFRHIFSTIAHEHDFNTQAIEAQLSHKDSTVRGVYNKAEYLDQRRELMTWYADHLDNLEGVNHG